jgi:hypothetical protein
MYVAPSTLLMQSFKDSYVALEFSQSQVAMLQTDICGGDQQTVHKRVS